MTSPVRGKVTVEVIADTRRFAGQLERQLRTALRRIRIAPDPDIDDQHIRRAGDRVGNSFTQSVGKGLKRLGSVMGTALGGLSKLMAGFGAVGAIGLFAASMLSAVASVGSFVMALAPAVGIIAVLPGILSAAGIAAGVFALGFEDLKEVISETTKGPLEELKKIAGTNLTKGLEDGIKGLVKAWMPMLRDNVKGVSQSLNAMMMDTIKFAATKSVVADWGSVMKNTNTGLMIMKSALTNLFSAFTDLSVVGSEFFPRLATSIQNATARFKDFISGARESGQIKVWIEAALTVFKQLWFILQQLGGIFEAVFSVASIESDTLLARIGALLQGVNQFLSSAEGISTLVTIFGTVGILMDSVQQSLMILAPAITGSVIPAIASVAMALAGVLPTIATALGQGLSALAPAIAPLAKALAGILAAVAPLLPVVGQLAAVVAGALTGALTALLPAIESIVGALVSSLTPILPVIASLFSQMATAMAPIAEALGGLIAQAIQMLVPIIVQLMSVIAPLIADHFGRLMEIVQVLLPPIMELVAVLAAELVPVMGAVMTAVGQVIDALLPLLPPIAELIEALIPLIPMVAELAVTLIESLVPAIIPVIEVVVQLAQQILTILVPVLEFIVTYVVGPLISALDWLVNKLGAVLSAIIGWAAGVLKAIMDLPGKIKGFFSSAGSWLMDAGRNIIQGLINGISNMIGSLKAKLSSITSMIPSWKGPEDVDRRILIPAGQAVMQGFEAGIESQRASLKRLLGEVTRDINLPGTMLTARGGDGASADQPIVVDNYIQIGEEVVRVIRSEIRASNRQLVRAARSGSRSGEVIV